jgi:hypothetical protein
MSKKKDSKPEAPPLEEMAPFEIVSLNADALDIEELEARLEMAISIFDLSLYCGTDCGVNCGVNCGNNCVGNCTSLCGTDICSTDCGVNCGVDCGIDCGTDGGCFRDSCGTMAIP